MEATNFLRSTDNTFWLYAVPLLLPTSSSSSCLHFVFLLLLFVFFMFLSSSIWRWCCKGGPAWSFSASSHEPPPGPRGLPFIGSILDMRSLAHRRLCLLAHQHFALPLMAFSLGSTRVVVSSKPDPAREILVGSCFVDRPLKVSAQQLLFDRAIGFAPYGDYWRKLRRIAASHLFSPKRIAAHECHRQAEANSMLHAIQLEAQHSVGGAVRIRPFLQQAALNNVMITVFGKRYEFGSECEEARELLYMVREGFELLGAFNLSDHLPVLQAFDPQRIRQRGAALVPRVNVFVAKIISEHRISNKHRADCSDFVHTLLGMQAEEKLLDADIIAILWEMIFRGTDSVAILLEWILAELVLHPQIQDKLTAELHTVVGNSRQVCDSDIPKLRYLQAVVNETLRLHPPGPLLSWARLATHDTEIAGHHIPAGTTAMVNMWAITHDPSIWKDSEKFMPERFMESEGGVDIDIRGSDLRLAPFGAGRRVCPGRALGLATVHLWLALLVQKFQWSENSCHKVDLSEHLKLSCEMKTPLSACAIDRGGHNS